MQSSEYERMKCVVIVISARSASRKSRLVPEFFDAGKNVIPAAAVQPGGMLAQLVKNFVHLERGRNRFDQHRRANRPLRNAELVLREFENVVPDARLEMALHFRQVKIRTASARDQFLRVVKKVETEIEQARRRPARHRRARVSRPDASRAAGRTRTAIFSFSWYSFPSGLVKVIVRRIASRRLIWPSTMLSQVGEFASSKSAMKIFAPELSALITILRSVGPVISTRRSRKSAGIGAHVQSPSRMCFVSGKKSSASPPSKRCLPLLPPLQTFQTTRAEISLEFCDKIERLRCEDLSELGSNFADDLNTV